MENLTPQKIVEELDKYIVGQDEAKKSVAIALRNRYRRQMLPDEIKEEVAPKNILMIGPTGVGKTEIARRLAKLVNAPFVKVEATKFTEVGYVGRDVESMVRDLVETSIRMVKQEKMEAVKDKARELADLRIAEILYPIPKKNPSINPLEAIFGATSKSNYNDDEIYKEKLNSAREKQKEILEKIKDGSLDKELIEIEVEDKTPPMLEVFSASGMEEMGINFQDMFGGLIPKRRKKRKVTIENARRILTQEEAQKLIDMDEVINESIEKAENSGIIFIDEIDKIAGKESHGPDVSREGVQRDILPIVEGSTVITKYGPVKTDHILFIAAGAFHISKPSDLIPELQGRFPIRVELKSLTERDLKKILTEPKNSLIKQYTALIETEGIKINFSEDAIDEIVKVAVYVNQHSENIGARRLATIMEKLLEDILFAAPELSQRQITIDAKYVNQKLKDIIKDKDLSMYIL
ncbi:MAG TPA: ATP-dependent protease ATPase subunit HslU [Thermoanaerobacterales bacterium]|uniref:ATP-dependent protease ATPase subunit HslU n=1 Tax=Tepidanaerobacter sp. GT38 TaxID=2722793 RepID=UPI0017FF569D|nr:ATP-dependent protease ATPase subunit HslU [Tepidanaerobacter sp. GT38]MCG1012424.1 ATP-dependent protease ATPase subunit HslU [Tepidanaerobacter sp. GT38]HHY41926.1 ATP-dependent protease ATPase subunit HslU [Thermoanaerobacterales bacterium]